MPTIVIRDVPKSVVAGLEVRAAAAGMSREAWLRTELEHLSLSPRVLPTYTIWAQGPGDAFALIRRLEDSPEGVIPAGVALSELQQKTWEVATDLVRRNRPGDRERAIGALVPAFAEVGEQPV
jgi:hypothetical protein